MVLQVLISTLGFLSFTLKTDSWDIVFEYENPICNLLRASWYFESCVNLFIDCQRCGLGLLYWKVNKWGGLTFGRIISIILQLKNSADHRIPQFYLMIWPVYHITIVYTVQGVTRSDNAFHLQLLAYFSINNFETLQTRQVFTFVN